MNDLNNVLDDSRDLFPTDESDVEVLPILPKKKKENRIPG